MYLDDMKKEGENLILRFVKIGLTFVSWLRAYKTFRTRFMSSVLRLQNHGNGNKTKATAYTINTCDFI